MDYHNNNKKLFNLLDVLWAIQFLILLIMNLDKSIFHNSSIDKKIIYIHILNLFV